jgi:hypothetical protein
MAPYAESARIEPLLFTVMRGLDPVRANLDINAQPLGCHAPLHAGHPVITPRQVEAKVF